MGLDLRYSQFGFLARSRLIGRRVETLLAYELCAVTARVCGASPDASKASNAFEKLVEYELQNFLDLRVFLAGLNSSGPASRQPKTEVHYPSDTIAFMWADPQLEALLSLALPGSS